MNRLINYKNVIATVIIGLLIFSSCSNKTNQNTPEIVEEETPEVFDNKKDIEIASISRRHYEDIIERLFKEAVEKDPILKDLVDEIDQISDLKYDSLKNYHKYIQNNEAYWSTADRYINQINDSTLKNEMTKTFEILENAYDKTLKPHEKAMEELGTKTYLLSDYEVILKLIVSERMINNYQRNELPDIKTIYGLVNSYDTLTNDVKEYIEIKK